MYYYSEKKLSAKILGKVKGYSIASILHTREIFGYIYFLENTEKTLYVLLSDNVIPIKDQKLVQEFFTAYTNMKQRRTKLKEIHNELGKIRSELAYATYHPDKLVLSPEYIKAKKVEAKNLQDQKPNFYEGRDFYNICWNMRDELKKIVK